MRRRRRVEAGRSGGWRPRLTTTGIVATLLFLFVASYRFNTLGGALGGFDNDHFLHFALAKQVEAGEQPLRDFLDGGLQGARPSLTYELSALAQRLMGDNLRSEALLNVLAVATAATVTFVAATHVAPWPVALVTAVLAALLSPKLYGYPKVLVLAVACLLILKYARTPGWWLVAAMSLWTAVGFLFRHDYSVYCGLGSVMALALAGPPIWWKRVARVCAYAAVTIVLLTPSLYWVQQSTGLAAYVRNGVEMGRRDAQRTTLRWPVPAISVTESPAANFEREENSQAWLYYTFLTLAWAVPVTALVRLRRNLSGDPRDVPMLAIGAMTALLSLFFLRGSLEARFGDMGPPLAIVASWVMVLSVEGSHRPLLRRAATGALAVAVLGMTAAAIWALQGVRTELDRAGLRTSPAAVVLQAARIWIELGGLPGGSRGPDVASPSGRSAYYLHECTRPDDRVLVVSYAPEVEGLSGRLFAGGRASFVPGFYEDERYSRFLLERLRAQSVPLVLAEEEPYYVSFPGLADYLRQTYEERGRIEIDGGKWLRVLAHKAWNARSFGPDGLPCFDPSVVRVGG